MSSSLSNKSLSILGTISLTRLEVRQLAEKVGMKIVVGINNEYIIAGEGANQGQVDTAKNAGATVWTETQFKKAIEKAEKELSKKPAATAAPKKATGGAASKKAAAASSTQQQSSVSLSGKSLSILGSLNMTRLEVRQQAEKIGMKIVVGINNDFIIAGANANQDQVNTAKSAGATIWSEGEFLKAVEQEEEDQKANVASKRTRQAAEEDDEQNSTAAAVNESKQPHQKKVAKTEGGSASATKAQQQPSATSIFQGKTVCFTGALQTMTRTEAKALAEKAGAKVTTQVSGKTDYVVVGANAGDKLDTAKANGCKILSEETFKTKARITNPALLKASALQKNSNDDDEEDEEDDFDEEYPQIEWDEAISLEAEPDFDNQTLIEVESKLGGYRLPGAYVALMKHSRNGGIPKKRVYKNPKTGLRIDIETIFGISTADDNNGNSIVEEQENWIEEWEYPKVGVYFSMTSSGGHDMLCFDYTCCGKRGEPKIAHFDQEADMEKTIVARNFKEFMESLIEDDEDDF